MDKNNYILIMLAAVGIALGVFEQRAALAYGVAGLLLVSFVQLKLAFSGSPGWFLFGGNPFAKLGHKERSIALIGVIMLFSSVVTSFVSLMVLNAL